MGLMMLIDLGSQLYLYFIFVESNGLIYRDPFIDRRGFCKNSASVINMPEVTSLLRGVSFAVTFYVVASLRVSNFNSKNDHLDSKQVV